MHDSGHRALQVLPWRSECRSLRLCVVMSYKKLLSSDNYCSNPPKKTDGTNVTVSLSFALCTHYALRKKLWHVSPNYNREMYQKPSRANLKIHTVYTHKESLKIIQLRSKGHAIQSRTRHKMSHKKRNNLYTQVK